MRTLKRVLLFLVLGATVFAGPQPAPLAELPPQRARGVQVKITSAGDGRSDVRADRLIALAVPAGEAPTALLSPGTFRAHFDAAITMPLRTEVTFLFSGSGAAILSINGMPVLNENGPDLGSNTGATVRLNKGANRIFVTYDSPATGDAIFRLDWQGRDFGREPVPPQALSHDASAVDLRAAQRVREGRLLFAQRQCIRCHEATPLLPAPGTGMPELGDLPPSLEDAGARFRSDWIAAWIANPKGFRADAAMPRVHSMAAQDVADIAAFLAMQGRPAPSPEFNDAMITIGGGLFGDLRCTACHELPGTAEPDRTFTRVSLEHVKAKWQPAALVSFLLNPADYHPATRMPQFHLSNPEARALTAFLLSREGRELPKTTGDAARGREIFQQADCRQCHGGNGEHAALSRAPALAATLAGDWKRGCLADHAEDRGTAPDFYFEPEQREALRAFAATGLESLREDAPVEFAARQFAALRCAACHERDGRKAAYAELGEEVAALQTQLGQTNSDSENTKEEGLDQEPPQLTWAGEKLKTDWLRRQIAGEPATHSRPWLKARMPGFSRRAEGMARGLAHEHGRLATKDVTERVDPAQAAFGEKLIGMEAFNCTTCHAVGSQPASAPFGAPGINFALVHPRLRREYFHRWMDNPLRVTPNTKMPKFTDHTGRSTQAEILDGDAQAQWDAIYAYLQTLAETSRSP